MKLLSTILGLLILAGGAHAQSNGVPPVKDLAVTPTPTNTASTNKLEALVDGMAKAALSVVEPKKDYGKYDLTLGGDGFTSPHTLKNGFEFDVSLTTDHFARLTNLWVGLDQGMGWEPSFAGSTDFTSWWPFGVYADKVYFNPGWSAGVTYGEGDPSVFRSGPLVECQYFFWDTTFLYGDINYDLLQSRGNGNFRYSFGFGIEF